MRARDFQRRVLELVHRAEQVTVASVVLELDVTAAEARDGLEAMVDEALLELDSFDDGTLFYHAPGLRQLRGPPAVWTETATSPPTWRGRLPSSPLGRTVTLLCVLSILTSALAGIAALLAQAREASIFATVALCGLPGTLVALVWWIDQLIRPRR